jgi:hypothetical protein
MFWFKIILTIWWVLNVVVAIYQASKGKHQMTISPGAQSFSAVLSTLFIVGTWIIL